MSSGPVAATAIESTMQPRERAVLGLFTARGAVMAGLLGAAFVAMFYRFFALQHAFSSDALEDWGHAYVIPLISGYMVWQRREALSQVRAHPFWPGLVLLMLGLVSYAFMAVVVGNHMFAGAAMLLALSGLVLTVLGVKAFGLLFLPIAFLALGITISERVMIELTFRLQLVASQGAYVVLSVLAPLLDYTVSLQGNTLTVVEGSGAEHALNVAEACSGMRMVVAFVALAGAVALLGVRAWWQRFALLMMSVPVALLMNIVRVAVLGLVSLVDPELSAGEAHMFIGTLLLVPALGLFMLVGWALKRMAPDEPGGEVA